MAYAIGINQKSLEGSIDDYKKVEFTPEQKFLIENIAKYIGEFLEIPEMIIKVLTWKSLYDWQIKNNQAVADLLSMPVHEKIIAVKELFNMEKKN